jgi:hypothetical protein
MHRSLKYLAVFVILFFLIDISTGWVMNRTFPNITFGTYGKVNRSLEADEDILIFGSSRAEHHYNPEIISKETGKSCYNTGLGGYGLFYNYALFSELVKKNKPELVILDLSPNVIVDPNAYMKLNIFMPYYFDDPSFREIIRLDPDFSRFKTFFNIYVYNSTLYDMVRGKVTGDRQGNGYKGLQPTMNVDAYTRMTLSENENMDDIKKVYLEKFLDVAITNNIRLICMISPTYEKFDANDRIIGELSATISQKGIEFYDYSSFDELYHKPAYFKDQLHLNARGVEVFNHELGRILLQTRSE